MSLRALTCAWISVPKASSFFRPKLHPLCMCVCVCVHLAISQAMFALTVLTLAHNLSMPLSCCVAHSANGKPSTTYPSSFENSLPDWGQDVPKSPSKSPPRKYGDIKMPLHAAVSPSAASTESERRESGQNDLSLPDENISLAIYFDEEMRLLCQLPAAARAMRRDLVADLAKVLR